MAILDANQSDVGIIGLDVTGRNVALRLAESHFKVAAYDWSAQKRLAFRKQIAEPQLRVTAHLSDLAASLRLPRILLIFSDADAPLSLILDRLLPELKSRDLLMDAGNSHFTDTANNQRWLAERRIQFMGVGLAGGETGARHGAAVMAGGGREARQRSRRLLEALAGAVHGEPSLCFCDSGAAAHFARMAQAGVEQALLQLLAESFDVLQRALLLTDENMEADAGAWRFGGLNEYLMEISARVFMRTEPATPRMLLREALQSAKNDPWGRWATQSARDLETPIPAIEAAVEPQSAAATERRKALLAAPFRHPAGRRGDDRQSVLDELHGALRAAMIIAYAQGMALLGAASERMGFRFNRRDIARAWRGGAPLGASVLGDIATALETTPNLPGLLSDDDLSQEVMDRQENLRRAIWRAHGLEADVPALLASLDYLDANRAAWLPVNIVQAPRRRPGSRSAFSGSRS
jgi:6-phosphogluconate dehydrogenase